MRDRSAPSKFKEAAVYCTLANELNVNVPHKCKYENCAQFQTFRCAFFMTFHQKSTNLGDKRQNVIIIYILTVLANSGICEYS